MNDEVVWQIINHQFCSYKVKTKTQNFCRNEYNVTGLCNRQSCPLASSQYATVREIDGKIYLLMKTVERSHTPAKLWQKIRLSKSYGKALAQIDKEIQYWPKFLVHKCKQRLTKISQYLSRMRKLRLKDNAPKLVGIKPKIEKREKSRERKAESAARLELNIQKELLDRLKSGIYGDIYNFNEKAFKEMIDEEEIEDIDEDADQDLDDEDLDEDDEMEREFVEGDFTSDEEDIEELEYDMNSEDMNQGLEIEYENETAHQ